MAVVEQGVKPSAACVPQKMAWIWPSGSSRVSGRVTAYPSFVHTTGSAISLLRQTSDRKCHFWNGGRCLWGVLLPTKRRSVDSPIYGRSQPPLEEEGNVARELPFCTKPRDRERINASDAGVGECPSNRSGCQRSTRDRVRTQWASGVRPNAAPRRRRN